MWKTIDNKLYQKFTFDDFTQATDFINRVAAIAQNMNHHPTLQNTYNTVELWLSTHSEGNIVTELDQQFADQVDQLFAQPEKAQQGVLFPKEMKLYGDGGSRGNPGPSALGFVLMDMNDHVLFEKGVYLGITTNNQAEYQALKQGMEEALRQGVRELHAHMDSLLVINQMKGIFKVKNRDLWPIHQAIKDMVPKFKKVTFTHVPRELNKLADGQVNLCLDAEAKT